MSESDLPSKWIVLGRVLLDFILRHAPAWFLKRLYPIVKCQERIEFCANGVGPHLYVNPERPAALSHLKLWCYNHLPFDIWIADVELAIQLGDLALASVALPIRARVSSQTKIPLAVTEHYLTDGQAQRVRQYPGETEILRVTGRAWIEAPVDRFEKHLDQLETRAFIYRG